MRRLQSLPGQGGSADEVCRSDAQLNGKPTGRLLMEKSDAAKVAGAGNGKRRATSGRRVARASGELAKKSVARRRLTNERVLEDRFVSAVKHALARTDSWAIYSTGGCQKASLVLC